MHVQNIWGFAFERVVCVYCMEADLSIDTQLILFLHPVFLVDKGSDVTKLGANEQQHYTENTQKHDDL